ncbi:hypothetical protein GCM10007898_12990 [Dyella flagellata]|uniref:Thioesterase domain-containing protein n=2 Tax=Dyella flagellata TaxID=1867833 RepID=A0ABQ5X7Y6_9GAMM|nr:hypothetical protein GCM10007898_12990 [Dyella flagellata]
MAGYAPLTKAPQGYEVVTAEFKINFLRPALGERFLAIGKVQNAGKLLTVCTGEVRAFVGDESAYDGSRLSALLRRAGVAIGSPVAKPIAKASSKAGLIPCIWLGYVGLTMLDLCASG